MTQPTPPQRPPSRPVTVLQGFPAAPPPVPRPDGPRRRGAGLLAGLLILTGVIVLLLALPIDQVKRTTDPDRLAAHASAILADPEVQDALADEVTARITTRVTSDSNLARRTVRAAVAPRVERLLASDRFAAAWEQGVRTAATRLLDPSVDYVAVDVADIVAMTAAVTRPFPPSIARPLERAGPITVLNVDRTPEQQRGLETLEWLNGLAVPGMLIGAALLLLAVLVSRNRRRTVITIGVALILLSLLLLALTVLARNWALDAAAAGRDRDVARVVADELLGAFRTRNLIGAGLGALMIAVALLTRRPRSAPRG